ncbi:MAG TPA: DUF1223 domain-containing protein [Candidatus Acidoferrum sp.]|nr:DUF1223 domain-containing protein [Candidatus Acidoferrum sp.]
MRFRISLAVLVALGFVAIVLRGGLRAAASPAAGVSAGAAPTPVLVELFTSEGCSDCPPADALLARLDHAQPVSSADVIVLSEHVDYWNNIGWNDPFSSHAYSERQDAYASSFHLWSVYTPQMVVDGRFQLVGSDERGAVSAIESASRDQKIRVALSSARWSSPNEVSLHVEADPLPSSVSSSSAELWIAAADDSDVSHVAAGENDGRTLCHVSVLRAFRRAGSVSRSAGFSGDVNIALPSGHAGNLRLIAVVQDPAPGPVYGLASSRLSP